MPILPTQDTGTPVAPVEQVPQAEPAPDMNLDPVKIKEAADVVAQAKKAMEYLKDALDSLKTGKKEKAAGEGVNNPLNPNNNPLLNKAGGMAKDIYNFGKAFAPAFRGGGGSSEGSTEELFSAAAEETPEEPKDTRGMLQKTMDQMKEQKARDQEILDSL